MGRRCHGYQSDKGGSNLLHGSLLTGSRACTLVASETLLPSFAPTLVNVGFRPIADILTPWEDGTGASMDRFEFYFSFYGLLLGLSVAEVAGGCANAVGARKLIRLGWLTPLLAIFVLLDISSFWIQAWRVRHQAAITYPAIFIGLAVALAYYLAAALVFPRQLSEWSDLDEHYTAHKKHVLGGVLFANLVVTGIAIAYRPEIIGQLGSAQDLLYFSPLIALFFTRRKLIDAALLAALIIFYIAGAATGWFETGVSPTSA